MQPFVQPHPSNSRVQSLAACLARHPTLTWGGTMLALLVLLQHAAASQDWINARKFPPAGQVISELHRLASSGQLWPSLSQTLTNWLTATVLALCIGMASGLAIGLNRHLEALTRPIIEFIRPVPSTALIPLVILWLGANAEGALFLTIFGTVWQVLPLFIHAVHSTAPLALDTARVYGLSRYQTLRWVRLPSMWPIIRSAIRIAISASLVLLISMEFLAGINGIGKEVSIAYAGSNYLRMYAMIVTAILLGTLPNIWLSSKPERMASAARQ